MPAASEINTNDASIGDTALPRPFRLAAAELAPRIVLRERTDDDYAFLADVYASVREDELRLVAWSEPQKQAFLFDQFARQHEHYRLHYPRAEWLVVECGGERIGRMYLETTRVERRLMDISLLPPHRMKGIGSALMAVLLDDADRLGVPVTLHVEPFNPALRLYQRLGFVTVETRGIYYFMRRPVS